MPRPPVRAQPATTRAQRLIIVATMLAHVAGVLGVQRGPDATQELRTIATGFQIRKALKLEPHLDTRIKLLQADPDTWARLGRQPSDAELARIAVILQQNGFQRVLVVAPPGLRGPAALQPGANGVAAAVRVTSADDRRLDAAPTLPTRLLLRLEHGADAIPAAAVLPWQSWALLSAAGSAGFLDTESKLRAHAVYRVGDGLLLPNLALTAADGLRASPDGGLATAASEVPLLPGGLFYVDPLSDAEVYSRTISIASFWSPAGARLSDTLPLELRDALRGGRVAVIVAGDPVGAPDGHGGSMQGFAAFISQVNIAVSGAYVRIPFVRERFLLCYMSLMLLLFLTLRPSLSGRIGVGIVVGVYLLGATLFVAFGIYIPAGEAAFNVSLPLICVSVFATSDLLKERGRVERELETGRTVQRLLLPARLGGRVGDWEYQIVFRPYGPMSGDWVQVFEGADQSAGRAVLAIGDVVGKGPSAALMTATIATVWNSNTDEWRGGKLDIEAFVSQLDQTSRKTFKGEQNTTLSIALLDGARLSLNSYAAPFWFRIGPDGTVDSIRQKAHNPLGCSIGGPLFPAVVLTARPGDMFLAYTDGVMDGMAVRHRYMQSLKGQIAAGAATPLSPGTVIDHTLEISETNANKDDVTMLLIRYDPSYRQSPS